MTWDFGEINPFSDSGGNFYGNVTYTSKSLNNVPAAASGCVFQSDAAQFVDVRDVVCATDPPYYDNIGYADLSDFFYVWMRQTLLELFPREFVTILVPKEKELVATPFRFKGGRDEAEHFFLNGMRHAILNICRASSEGSLLTIYYAFKQAEVESEGVVSTGWATFLDAIANGGFQIDGTWPIRTERATGLKSAVNAGHPRSS